MSLLKMLDAVSTVGRLNHLRLLIRKNCTKAKIMKDRMREEKENFGPLLESSKKRKTKKQSLKTEDKTEKVSDDENSKKIYTNAELSWAIGTTKMTNLQFIRKIDKDKPKSCSHNAIRTQKLSRLSELLESNNPNDFKKSTLTNLSNTNNPTVSSETDNDIAPHSSTTIARKVDDGFVENIQGNDDKSCYESIGEETCLKSVENDSWYSPIINPLKGQDDKWENSGIVSLSPGEHKEYSLPGVTRILNETMSEHGKLLLEKWKKKMTKKLGEEGFQEYCKSNYSIIS